MLLGVLTLVEYARLSPMDDFVVGSNDCLFLVDVCIRIVVVYRSCRYVGRHDRLYCSKEALRAVELDTRIWTRHGDKRKAGEQDIYIPAVWRSAVKLGGQLEEKSR